MHKPSYKTMPCPPTSRCFGNDRKRRSVGARRSSSERRSCGERRRYGHVLLDVEDLRVNLVKKRVRALQMHNTKLDAQRSN